MFGWIVTAHSPSKAQKHNFSGVHPASAHYLSTETQKFSALVRRSSSGRKQSSSKLGLLLQKRWDRPAVKPSSSKTAVYRKAVVTHCFIAAFPPCLTQHLLGFTGDAVWASRPALKQGVTAGQPEPCAPRLPPQDTTPPPHCPQLLLPWLNYSSRKPQCACCAG